MRKFLILLSSSFLLILTPLSILNNKANVTNVDSQKAPEWVEKMTQLSPNKINIGYDQYFLINKKEDKTDRWQQQDWINLSENNDLYLYLPQANNIADAVKDIRIDDTASTVTIGIETPVTWNKVNETTYTNNTFITEDTSIHGNALMDNKKYQDIKTGSKAITAWTEKEKNTFEKSGGFPAGVGPGRQQDWWNSNGWEKLLSVEKNLPGGYSQKDLYQKWIEQKVIGMNVPLSLIDKNSFTITTTEFNHIFQFKSTIKEAWIDNNSNLISIPTPHWGFTLEINNQGKTIFQTPQLINLNNAFHEEDIKDYLQNTAKYYSFNSQKETKFKDNYIA